MDFTDTDFLDFLDKVNKLENYVKRHFYDREFQNILYKKYYIDIKHADDEYNKLLIKKITEHLIHDKIFYLLN